MKQEPEQSTRGVEMASYEEKTMINLEKRRERQKKYQAAHYQNNKKYYVDKAKKQKEEIRQLLIETKSIPCSDCGKGNNILDT